MKHTVKSTKELKALFPELPRTNRFKRRLDEVFEKGFEFELKEAEKPFHTFNTKGGKRFRWCISRNGNSFGFKRAKVDRMGGWTMEHIKQNPDIFRNVAEKPGGKSKQGDGPWIDTFEADRFVVRETSWAELCKEAGKLIEEELVEVEECGKCQGRGFIPGFAHVANGVCFDCMGMGKWFIVKDES